MDPFDFEPNSKTWKYLDTYLHDHREILVGDLIDATDSEASARLKGQIQLIDTLLEIPSQVDSDIRLSRG